MSGQRSKRLPFDFRSLEIFLAVCETKTMGAAARRLKLTQPAVSQAIAEIEQQAGVLLFDRSMRPLDLTSAGLALQQRASALMKSALEIPVLLREIEHVKLPLVRVGLIDSLSRCLLKEISVFLMRRAQKISVVSGLALQATALMNRRLDVVLSAEDLSEMDGLQRWPILAEPFLILCPAGLVGDASPLDFESLARQAPLLRFPSRSKSGAEIDQHLRRMRLEVPRTEEFDTPYGLTAAVSAGLGWAITTPVCVMEAGLPLDGLQMMPLPGPRLHRIITLIAHEVELGTLPENLAELACGVLREKCRPFIKRHCPWAADQFVIGPRKSCSP
jgi:DNA-binding transcriptional LysR family regulator